MTKATVLLAALVLMLGKGCSAPAEQHARDTAAALNGAIVQAQKQHQTSCQSDPGQQVCVIINKSVEGQNALITAVEAYCGWSTAAPPADLNATCVPVKSAQAGLQTAVANADLFVAELKGVIK